MAPLGPAQERQAVSKSGCTFEQLVEAAEAYPTLVHRHLEASGECAAAVDNLRKMRSLGDVRNPLPDGTSRPWPVATHAAEREVLAQHELISALEAFTICSETLETGAVQHKLAVDDHDQDDGRYTLKLNDRIYELDGKELRSHIVHSIS